MQLCCHVAFAGVEGGWKLLQNLLHLQSSAAPPWNRKVRREEQARGRGLRKAADFRIAAGHSRSCLHRGEDLGTRQTRQVIRLHRT